MMLHKKLASKIIFAGLEGSGKSLRLAHMANIVLTNNIYFFKKTGIPRDIWTNIKFSDDFVTYAYSKGIEIKEWTNLEELIGLEGCDIFIDEIGTYFDSRLWSELPLTVRRWIAQCDKNGVNIYGTAQDFAQIDKSFRRLVSTLYQVRKLMGSSRPHRTYPLIKRPWGVFLLRQLDARGYKEDAVPPPVGSKAPSIYKGWPSFFLLHKVDYSVYSTNQGILESKALPLRHLLRVCKVCGLEKVVHS